MTESFYANGKRKSLTPKRRAELFFERSGACCICGGRIDGTRERWIVEHIIPIADHQSDVDANQWENLAPAHEKCARAKTSQEASSRSRMRKAAQRHIGAKSSSKWRTGRNSKLKRKIDGTVVRRDTGEPV